MKHQVIKVIRIFGVLSVVPGVALVILQLTTTEKSVVGWIAGGAMPIIMGALVPGYVACLVEAEEGDPSDTPK